MLLHRRFGRHVSRDPLGIADHRQQVPRCQALMGGIPNADFLRQQERVSNRPAELVATLGLGGSNHAIL